MNQLQQRPAAVVTAVAATARRLGAGHIAVQLVQVVALGLGWAWLALTALRLLQERNGAGITAEAS